MRKLALTLTLAATAALGACQKTGEGEYQVKTPDVDVNTKTTTVETPSVDVGTKKDTINTPVVGTTKDTLVVDRPTVDVKTRLRLGIVISGYSCGTSCGD